MGEFLMTRTLALLLSVAASLLSHQGNANQCSTLSGKATNSLACSDSTAARFLDRLSNAQKALEKRMYPGARVALRNNQTKWEQFTEAWLTENSHLGTRCSSPRALIFQRMESLEKALMTLNEIKPKTIDLCYDNAACLAPGALNTEMICESIQLGVEGVPKQAEPLIIKLIGEWNARGNGFETRILKSVKNNEPCELVDERHLVEYLRGGYVTVRSRQGNTCDPQSGSEQVKTFDLRSGRALTMADFTDSPKHLLKVLNKSKEAEVLQALLRSQLSADTLRPRIEPNECSKLPFSMLKDVHIHFVSDGLRVSKLFKNTPPELSSCQFKVEDGLSPSTVGLLLKDKPKSPARAMLKYFQ
jgi:hypothetical protein